MADSCGNANTSFLPPGGRRIEARRVSSASCTIDSLRQCYRTSQRGVSELARCHRLAKQESLSDVET
jgi:hypothetical protein